MLQRRKPSFMYLMKLVLFLNSKLPLVLPLTSWVQRIAFPNKILIFFSPLFHIIMYPSRPYFAHFSFPLSNQEYYTLLTLIRYSNCTVLRGKNVGLNSTGNK